MLLHKATGADASKFLVAPANKHAPAKSCRCARSPRISSSNSKPSVCWSGLCADWMVDLNLDDPWNGHILPTTLPATLNLIAAERANRAVFQPFLRLRTSSLPKGRSLTADLESPTHHPTSADSLEARLQSLSVGMALRVCSPLKLVNASSVGSSGSRTMDVRILSTAGGVP
ncbi:unnamed protein product [Polarella glacialis]|uniref:Uncharacterized protein n=1 Tax=Polarella glacialis TaxID=89957 RepID=A0A813GQX5_POLGL|nr:unnamed protein product [Polarella glacialis]